MEPQARYIVVGASVLGLVAMLTAAFAWLLTSGNANHTRHYTLRFAHQSLDGLEPRSDVRMKGIRIGSVASLAFSKQAPGSVEVGIDVDASVPVRQSTQAVIDRNLVTGLASIRLVTTREDSPPLQANTVIPEGESRLQQFSQTMGELAQRAGETLQRIDAALSPANQSALSETLQNLQLASRSTGELTRNANRALASVAHAADALGTSTTRATTDVHRLADRYDSLGAQAGASVSDAKATLDRLAADVAKVSAQADALLSDTDVEVRATASRLRAAADAVAQTAHKLDDPRAAVLGPSGAALGPGEAQE